MSSIDAERWRQAATLFRQSRGELPQTQNDINSESRKFDDFLRSEEGFAAMDLLAASKFGIELGSKATPGCIYKVVLTNDDRGRGFILVETMYPGREAQEAERRPILQFTPLSTGDAFRAIVEYGRFEPKEIVSYIFERLDFIADKAPKADII